MTLLALLLSIIIWGIVFYILWWAVGAVALPDPFNKVATVILVIAAVWVILGLLMGTVAPFPFVLGVV